MDKIINFTITPVWAVIEHIRKKIQSQLKDSVGQDIVDATTICAIELSENAVKYGESVANMQYIQFQLKYSTEKIEIEISNGVVKQEDMENVCSTIDKLNGGQNPEKLYLERLTDLMEKAQSNKSQLGILRIANETGFSLGYKIDGNALTVTAIRKLN